MASGRDEQLEAAVAALAAPVAADAGVDVVDVEVRGHPGSRVVLLVVDRDEGIDVETCAELSRDVGRALDDADLISGRYTLQVTSPGVDRPLRTERDFARNIGRSVRVARDRDEVEGLVTAVDAGTVTLDVDGEAVAVPLADVDHARVLLPW
ncbi:MAG: ribosome maturation factor RimP [Nitriliruptorales bacterium]